MAGLGLHINTKELCMMICLIGSVSLANARSKNKTRCFGHICLQPGYSPDNIPPNKDNSPLKVDMDFKISPLSVDCDHNIVGLSIILRQTWFDNRIYSKEDDGKFSWLPTRMGRNPETGIPQEVWMPNLFFYSMTKMEIQTNFREQSLLWLFQDDAGDRFLNYESQFDLYVKCEMKYGQYPFDEHECFVRISSIDLNASKLYFNMPKKVSYARNANSVGYFDIDIIHLNSTELEDVWEGEKWSLTGFKLKLRRRYWRHIVNYYLSSAVFVIISWVSFLVPQDDQSARIPLLVTMLLVLVTVFNCIIENSPNAREGPTALDFWMLSMLFFIFLEFICHCVAMFIRRKEQVAKLRRKKFHKAMANMINPTANSSTPLTTKQNNSDGNIGDDDKDDEKFKTHLMDLGIFVILAILFLLYVIVYFILIK